MKKNATKVIIMILAMSTISCSEGSKDDAGVDMSQSDPSDMNQLSIPDATNDRGIYIPISPDCNSDKDCESDSELMDPSTARCLISPITGVSECTSCLDDNDCDGGEICEDFKNCVPE